MWQIDECTCAVLTWALWRWCSPILRSLFPGTNVSPLSLKRRRIDWNSHDRWWLIFSSMRSTRPIVTFAYGWRTTVDWDTLHFRMQILAKALSNVQPSVIVSSIVIDIWRFCWIVVVPCSPHYTIHVCASYSLHCHRCTYGPSQMSAPPYAATFCESYCSESNC